MSGLDLSVTMLTIKHAELRVINSGGVFLNFFLDRKWVTVTQKWLDQKWVKVGSGDEIRFGGVVVLRV